MDRTIFKLRRLVNLFAVWQYIGKKRYVVALRGQILMETSRYGRAVKWARLQCRSDSSTKPKPTHDTHHAAD